ncbi:LysR substrate-binding domain-containing protein [Pseudomonas sp. P39-UII1]|uniref:LysR substrate-binding domain-containing protein n=1 Tax=Pseudomonas sp. P39-UII1 TaxID=3080333 RepID=UPI00320A8250
MDNVNDLVFFASVVEYGGFSAAARATGIDKTRLSRRLSSLEERLGVRLLQRNTRSIALTEAGQHLYVHARELMNSANSAFESVAALRAEPSGTVRLSCPQILAQSYLAPILPGYLATHPKVKIELDATDVDVDLLKERYDLALRANVTIQDHAGLVARELGTAKRVLVASPAFLDSFGRPKSPSDITELDTLCRPVDVVDGIARWTLSAMGQDPLTVMHSPRLSSNDLRLQLESAIHGIGVALLPEPIVSASIQAGVLEMVLPGWSAPAHKIHIVYPPPRGMLPSVRSLIDYLIFHLPASIQERSI